jgi:CRISPR/Cas system CSM-associated protein Csm5 (group 7 of RAMP superfamily)
MVKQSADLEHIFSQSIFKKTTTGQHNSKAVADHYLHKSKAGNPQSMVLYSLYLGFGYGSEQNLIGTLYWVERAIFCPHKHFERVIHYVSEISQLTSKESKMRGERQKKLHLNLELKENHRECCFKQG